MNQSELKAIRDRAEKATPGPWKVGNQDGWWSQDCMIEADDPECGLVIVADLVHTSALEEVDNKSFIVHARTDIPALLTEVERLQSELDELKQTMEENEWLLAEEESERKTDDY